ncbi:hypothetical protein EON66_10760, partial [archaeon]
RTLRDYQLEGVNWMVFNWHHHRNCILADEMGLGKTIQSVATLEHLRTRQMVRGPFLVLAPLSTLGHWKREFDEWTDMNAVYYHDPVGGLEARYVLRCFFLPTPHGLRRLRFCSCACAYTRACARRCMCLCSSLIRKHEWMFPGPRGAALASRGVYKFNALITSFQVLISDWEYLSTIRWRAVVVDEAHALKNRESQLQQALKSLHYDYILLLTGTPLQNDIPELWSLLNVIKPERYQHQSDFAAMYGQLKDSEQVQRLQQELAPIMLRRQKEDVEKSIPPKEETLVHVELTRLQKAYYRAVLERNRAFLLRGASSAPAASLMNIEMELRKCCDHPFLLSGAEQRETLDGSREHRIEVCPHCARVLARTLTARTPCPSLPITRRSVHPPALVSICVTSMHARVCGQNVQAMVSGSGK